jgi:hypothetical protein
MPNEILGGAANFGCAFTTGLLARNSAQERKIVFGKLEQRT